MQTNTFFLIKFAAIIVGIQIILGSTIYFIFPDWATRGQFGDMFGIVNSLFSGLAFAGLIYTILLQKEELSLQRDELKLTRIELKRTAEAQEKSEKALLSQAIAANQATKLATINYLLAHYQTQLEPFSTIYIFPNSKEAQTRDLLTIKRNTMLKKLDEVYNDITNSINEV